MNVETDMPGRLPRYCVEDTDRHGNVRVYLRRKGWPKVRLPGVPWTEPFMEAYRAAIDGTPAEVARDRHAIMPDTWRWLCLQYVASAKFRTLDGVTSADAARSSRRRGTNRRSRTRRRCSPISPWPA